MDSLASVAVEFDLKHRSMKSMSIEELEINEKDDSKVYWVHGDLNQPELFNLIASKLQLPEDVLKLCEQQDSLPKLIDADESLTLQVQILADVELHRNKGPGYANLIMHLTHKFCFTASAEPSLALEEFFQSGKKGLRYAQTPCFILFLILDAAINDYAKILFNYEFMVEQLDIKIHKTHKNIYHKVMDVKLQVMKIKRYVISLREILMRISGRNISVVSDQCRTSLSNLSNHTHMIIHETDSIRDILNGLLDGIENSLMQKMNETMKILTAFAAIFLPLTLITGIYGMNFHWMPELEWKYGYFFALGAILICGVGLFLVFKIKKWF